MRVHSRINEDWVRETISYKSLPDYKYKFYFEKGGSGNIGELMMMTAADDEPQIGIQWIYGLDIDQDDYS